MTLARQLPARFDVSVQAKFPIVGRTRLAHQIRQDMWRALRNLRGFSPVVQIEQGEDCLNVIAGGRLPKPVASNVRERLEALLNDRSLRARWIKHAGRGEAL